MRRLCLILISALSIAACAGAPKPGVDAPPALRIMAYNIHHGAGQDGELDIERIARVIASCDPDLVALQEVDNRCTRTGNRDLAAELGEALGMDHRFGKAMDFQGGEYGLAVLSRLPIAAATRHVLPKGAEPRCALEVLVEVERFDEPVSFVSIHNDHTGEEFRAPQVRALLDALRERSNPTILAGDFNSRPGQESMQILRDDGWRVLEKNAPGGVFTVPSDAPRAEIDYFVLRNLPPVAATHWVVDERVASDHRPIMAILEARR